MIDDATLARLHECVRRECRSLLQYVSEVSLWVGPDDRSAYDLVRDWAHSERQQVQCVADWMQRHTSGRFPLGQFPTAFTTWNDTSFRHALPVLVREHQANLAALEADASATIQVEPRGMLDHLVELKREHAAAFQTIAEAAGCA